MILYFERHGSIQRMQKKLVRVDYKLLVVAEYSEFVLQFDLWKIARQAK